jgi:VWFA-related protein
MLRIKRRHVDLIMKPRPTLLLRLMASVVLPLALLSSRDPQRSPTFRTEANHVRLDVIATSRGVSVTDLRKGDFELLEDGQRQEIEEFEHVAIPARQRTSQDAIAPFNPEESRAVAKDPRARVFVVFLDDNHVDLSGSYRIREPLTAALEQLIGPDDVFAVMTPSMPARALMFTRRTTTLAGELERHWNWGRRDNPGGKDSTERDCEVQRSLDPERAEELIARRREQQTLKALADLTAYLREVRDGRKAILLVTEGWKSHRSVGLSGCGVDPFLDGAHVLRSVMGAANRANASFYPIDPRGLPVFDQSITRPLTPGPGTQVSGFLLAKRPDVDAEVFRARRETLQTLADGTDGLAALDSNDLAASLARILTDLSSYYLLGYYSTGKLDGKFHAITVRVTRPGIHVRARRGYLATMETEPPAMTDGDAETARLAAVIAPLADYARELPLRVHAATGWRDGEAAAPTVWVQGELSGGRQPSEVRTADAVATIQLLSTEGRVLGTGRVVLPPSTQTFRAALTPTPPLVPGSYVVRVSIASADSSSPTPETMPITVVPRPRASGTLWMRRSASTRNRDVPTADLRFRRSERITVEIPAPTAEAGVARLLDRHGRARSIPVTTALRTDADGSQWLSAGLVRAPLATGDYIIELSGRDEKTLVAFAVVP